jgi:hypothetical protein
MIIFAEAVDSQEFVQNIAAADDHLRLIIFGAQQ